MRAHGVTGKVLITEAKRIIRYAVIQTRHLDPGQTAAQNPLTEADFASRQPHHQVRQ